MTLEGVYSVLPVAFSDSGDLDLSQRPVIDRLISTGHLGLALDRTRERARPIDQERATAFETVSDLASRREPLAAGMTADGTRACTAYVRPAKQLGAAAVSVQPLRMATRKSDAVARHFKPLAGPSTKRAVGRGCPCVTTQKGFEWISV